MAFNSALGFPAQPFGQQFGPRVSFGQPQPPQPPQPKRGIGGQIADAFAKNPNLLMAIGGQMLAHRNDARQPMFDPAAVMLGTKSDREMKEDDEEERGRKAFLTLSKKLGLDDETALAWVDAGMGETLLQSHLSQLESEPEWKVVGGQLVRIDPKAGPEWFQPPTKAEPGFRPATPEELERFGAEAGQIGPDNRFYPIDGGPSVSVTNNMPGNTMPQVGTIPQGFELRQTETGWQMAPIPGGPADLEQQQAERARENAAAAQDRYGGVVLEDIGRVRERVQSSPLTTGLPGFALSQIPGTDAYDVAALTDTIRANIGFDRLQQMRDSSPTGGALGEVTQRELGFLQATLGNLEQSQTEEQFLQNLDRLEQVYLDIIHGPGRRPNEAADGDIEDLLRKYE